MKELAEIKKLGQYLSNKSYIQSNPSGSNIVLINRNTSDQNNGSKSFFYEVRGPKRKSRMSCENHQSSQPYQFKSNRGYRH